MPIVEALVIPQLVTNITSLDVDLTPEFAPALRSTAMVRSRDDRFPDRRNLSIGRSARQFDFLLLDLHGVLGRFDRRSEFGGVNLGKLGAEKQNL
jgi:hypothetical protein